MRVYAATWFEVKRSPGIHHGPLHLLREVQRQVEVLSDSPSLLQRVKQITQWNAFYGHSEAILLNLISSDIGEDRKLGVDKIIRIREKSREDNRAQRKQKKEVRRYKPGKLNYDAKKVSELIILGEDATEPPLTLEKSVLNIESYLASPYKPAPYQCISQFTERCVKSTSEAVQMVSGELSHNGAVLNKHASRAAFPSIKRMRP